MSSSAQPPRSVAPVQGRGSGAHRWPRLPPAHHRPPMRTRCTQARCHHDGKDVPSAVIDARRQDGGGQPSCGAGWLHGALVVCSRTPAFTGARRAAAGSRGRRIRLVQRHAAAPSSDGPRAVARAAAAGAAPRGGPVERLPSVAHPGTLTIVSRSTDAAPSSGPNVDGPVGRQLGLRRGASAVCEKRGFGGLKRVELLMKRFECGSLSGRFNTSIGFLLAGYRRDKTHTWFCA